jgi:hypothetical protein
LAGVPWSEVAESFGWEEFAVTIVRVGTNKKFADGWDTAFGGKKAKKTTAGKTEAKKADTKKAAPAKKSAKKKGKK